MSLPLSIRDTNTSHIFGSGIAGRIQIRMNFAKFFGKAIARGIQARLSYRISRAFTDAT